MYRERRKRLTLMPAVALAALAALITVPTLSNVRLYAATPEHFRTVTVHRGDNLWSIAEQNAAAGTSVEEAVDAIISTNRLGGAVIHPGQTLRIPQ